MRRASRKQINYIRVLASKLEPIEAERISRAALPDVRGRGINVFERVGGGQHWQKEEILDTLGSDDASKLLNALLDKVGRGGRRKNNRAR